MGGELEKTGLQMKSKKDNIDIVKTTSRNHKNNKFQSITTDDNQSAKKRGSKSAIKTTNANNELKRGAAKKKKDKLSIFSKDK